MRRLLLLGEGEKKGNPGEIDTGAPYVLRLRRRQPVGCVTAASPGYRYTWGTTSFR
jgi:hypothetical protein